MGKKFVAGETRRGGVDQTSLVFHAEKREGAKMRAELKMTPVHYSSKSSPAIAHRSRETTRGGGGNGTAWWSAVRRSAAPLARQRGGARTNRRPGTPAPAFLLPSMWVQKSISPRRRRIRPPASRRTDRRMRRSPHPHPPSLH
jgi:hypothetical protein